MRPATTLVMSAHGTERTFLPNTLEAKIKVESKGQGT
jgi:hypothetical protein